MFWSFRNQQDRKNGSDRTLSSPLLITASSLPVTHLPRTRYTASVSPFTSLTTPSSSTAQRNALNSTQRSGSSQKSAQESALKAAAADSRTAPVRVGPVPSAEPSVGRPGNLPLLEWIHICATGGILSLFSLPLFSSLFRVMEICELIVNSFTE